MPRPNRVRYREDRDAWVTKLDGSLVTLAKGKRNRSESERALRALLAERDAGRKRRAQPLVGELVVAYLNDGWARVARDEMEPVSVQARADRLKAIAAALGGRRVVDLARADVEGAVPTPAGARRAALEAFRSMLRWAADQGLCRLDVEVLVPRAGRRVIQRGDLTPDQVAAILAATEGTAFGELVRFMHATGCRTAEAKRLEASHLAGDRIVQARHKTARRTGRPRVIHLPGDWPARLAALAARWPEGAILRNARGRRWTTAAIGGNVARVVRVTGVPWSLYSFRRLWATDALARNVPPAVVAAALGHSVEQLLRTYSQVDQRRDLAAEAARLIRPGDGAGPAAPPASPAPASDGAGGGPAPPAKRPARRTRGTPPDPPR
jgi:integrase